MLSFQTAVTTTNDSILCKSLCQNVLKSEQFQLQFMTQIIQLSI